jgi:EAL domain-containing protein (putative c-di-GMP-specific phosphodiesterase class I)/GGDEF domain-containing protein
MGLSKSFQLILLLVFGLLFVRVYTLEDHRVQIQAESARQNFITYVEKYRYWTGDGEDLYKTFSQDNSFQFFQYSHSSDSSHNYTFGTLATVDQNISDKLFKVDLDHSFNFPEGRMQVRLNSANVIGNSLANLQEIFELLFITYMVLMLLFALLVFTHKRRINYAAQYIDSISTLSFQAIETSRLKGLLTPIGHALEKCRSRLKESLESIRLENEKLTKSAYLDPVTEFSTRPRFITQLDKLTDSQKNEFGVLVMIKASELANINQLHGRIAGDDYLAQLSDCIRKAGNRNAITEYYRISSSDFALFLENSTVKDSINYIEKLKQQFDDYTLSTQKDSVAHIGIVPYQSANDPITLLAMADSAVSIAQTLGPNRFHYLEKFEGNEKSGDEHWKITINDIMNRRGVKFYQQPILPCNTDNDLYRELLSRFYNAEGQHLPTATVIAMAERYGLSIELDKMIVTNTLKLMQENPSLLGAFGVNISATSALQDVFIYWLKDILSNHRKEASRLVFEINESGMQTNLNASYRFVSELHKVGAKVAVERFGLGFTSFKFFREVRPDYIKLDSSYSDAIEADNNNKFFVRMIVDIAKRLNILVFATGVERQDEKLTLEKLLVDGLQGYYIAKPDEVIKSN